MDMFHRPLTYTITTEELDKIDERDEYLDLITMAGLFNAINYARLNGASYQLASFAIDEGRITLARETIYITGGLLFDAFQRIKGIVRKYKGKPFVMELADILESFTEYKLPEVLLEIRNAGPFRLATDERDFFFQTRKSEMFPMFTVLDSGFPIATVANESETMEKYKSGAEVEVHSTLESLVEFLTDEFILGAEEFIFAISNQLGLKPVEQQKPSQLPLAP